MVCRGPGPWPCQVAWLVSDLCAVPLPGPQRSPRRPLAATLLPSAGRHGVHLPWHALPRWLP